MDPFGEALSVVPIVHLPAVPNQRVILIGVGATAALETVLRYPTTAQVLVVDSPAIETKDRRVRFLQRIEQVPPDYKADLIIVAVPIISDSLLDAVQQRLRPDAGVVGIAIARPTQVRPTREAARNRWTFVQPYRENVPGQKEPSWFLLAGNNGFKRYRPIPAWTTRLSESYVPALFTLSKDEYTLAFANK